MSIQNWSFGVILSVVFFSAGCAAENLTGEWEGCLKSPAAEAISPCTKIIETDSDKINVARAHHNRGLVYDTAGKTKLALKDYNKAIELDATYSSPLNNRGIIYLRQKKLARALQDFNTSIELDPKNYYALNSRGRFFLNEKNDPNRALSDFKNALALNPSYSLTQANMGFAFEKLRKRDDAIIHFEKALALGVTAPQKKIISHSMARLKKTR